MIKQLGGYFDSVYLAHWSLPCLANNESRSSTIEHLHPRASCNPKAVGVQRGGITIRVPQSPESILVSAVPNKDDNLRRRDGLGVEGEGEQFDGLEAEAEAEAEETRLLPDMAGEGDGLARIRDNTTFSVVEGGRGRPCSRFARLVCHVALQLCSA